MRKFNVNIRREMLRTPYLTGLNSLQSAHRLNLRKKVDYFLLEHHHLPRTAPGEHVHNSTVQ